MSTNPKVFLAIWLTTIIVTSTLLTTKAVEIHSTPDRAAAFSPQALDMTLDNNTRFASRLLNISFIHPVSNLTLSLNGSTTGFTDIVNMNNTISKIEKKQRVERNEQYSINVTSDLRQAINFPTGTYYGSITAVYINSDSNQPESIFVPVNLNLIAAPSGAVPPNPIEPPPPHSNYVPLPYNITLGYENSTNSSIGNVTYKVRFDAPTGKIISGEVLNNTFDNNKDNIQLDNNNTVVFNATELMTNQSKIADVRLNLANFSIQKDPLPIAHIDVTINGTTQSSTIQLPRLDGLISEGIASSIPLTTTIIDKAEKVVDVAGKGIEVGEKGFNLISGIYNQTISCLNIEVNNASSSNPLNPTFNVEMENCSAHPELINLTITVLTPEVDVTYYTCKGEFELGEKDNSQCEIALLIPHNTSNVTFVIRGDILINEIGSIDSRIREVTYSPLSQGTTTPPRPIITSTSLVANAGPDQIVDEGTKNVTLYGINSLDSNDNNTITEYKWEYMGSSNHSVKWSGINNTNTNTDNLKFDVPNVTSHTLWTFKLTVTNDNKNSSSDIVNVLIRDINHPPVADNQTNVTTDEDTPKLITLTASETEGDKLDFTIISNPTHGNLSRANSTTNNVAYTPSRDYTGPDEFTFIASDGEYDSEPATVSITVNSVNDPPEAHNSSVITDEDTPVTITLSGSDDMHDNSSLSFSIISQPILGDLNTTFTRINNTAINITYVPDPHSFGSDSFSFKVNDGILDSTNVGRVSIMVNHVNHPPMANAGMDFVVNKNASRVTLNGSNSNDSDKGDSISSYRWIQTEGPPVNLTNDSTALPTFAVRPLFIETDTILKFNLTVTDNHGTNSTKPDTVVVTVRNVNTPPLANAGPDQIVNEGTVNVMLNGAESKDLDTGDNLTSYSWTQIEGPHNVTLSNSNTSTPSFSVPDLPTNIDSIALKFNLTVTDNHGTNSTKPDTVVVTVRNVNTPPLAIAGPDQIVNEGTKNVTLYGINSLDFDGHITNHIWKQIGSNSSPSNSSVINNTNTNTPNLKFDAPPNVTSDTLLTFELTVTDNKNSSDSDMVNVLIKDNQSQSGDINTPPETNGSGNNTTDIINNIDDGTLDNVNQPPEKENLSSIHMVFAIDSSGSMDDNDPEKLRLGLTTPFIDGLNRSRDDTAALISWDTNVDSFFGLTSNFTALEHKINEVDSEGGTNLDVGLEAAINVLDVVSNDNNSYKTIVLLSDGRGDYTPLDDPDSPVNDARNKGYTIFTIGLNVESPSDYENTLKNIANTTGGQYFLLSSEEDFDNIVSFISQQITNHFQGPESN